MPANKTRDLIITLSKTSTLVIISVLLILNIIKSPPYPLPWKWIDLLFLLLLSVLLPYIITFVQTLFDYKPLANREAVEKLKNLSGLKRMWVLHKNSKKVSFHARGTPLLPIILVKGDVSALTEDELLAALCHEAQHNRLWHFQISFFLLTSLIYILKPFGPLGLIFAMIASRVIGNKYEFYADRFASQKVSKEALASALQKLEGPRSFSLDFIPILNLLTTHPTVEERIERL